MTQRPPRRFCPSLALSLPHSPHPRRLSGAFPSFRRFLSAQTTAPRGRTRVDARRSAPYNPSSERKTRVADWHDNAPGARPSARGAETIREFEDRSAQWLFEDPENVRGLLQIQEPALAERLDFARAERIN